MTTRPDPRLAALPMETTPELSSAFQTYVKVLGFIPNSKLIMQRKPKIVQALSQLAAAIWDMRISRISLARLSQRTFPRGKSPLKRP